MTRHNPESARGANPPGFRVEAPRRSDAIGVALRDAFERDHQLPDDMSSMLRQLNEASTRSPF